MKEMQEEDRGSEMVELKEKVNCFFFASGLHSDDRLISEPKTDFDNNSFCFSSPDKNQELMVLFHLTFVQLCEVRLPYSLW